MEDDFTLDYTSEKRPDGTILVIGKIRGKVAPTTVLRFEEEVNALFDQGTRHIIFDCSGLEYMNSTGTGLMVKLMDKFEAAGGTMQMVNIPKNIRDLMDVLGLLDVFKVKATLAEAKASLN